ncbi:hypothetical protein ACGFNU_29760 [Spirillospora sp. NPDC048911]|uniref:hypothetical protein n=1 Tax=Spirillospora sp. NPDC048911 TaxID=3364527 RepID=UPI003720FC8E
MAGDDTSRADAEFKLAATRYQDARRQEEDARVALFDAAAEAVRSGTSVEELAAETPFSAAELRRQLHDRGVD